MNLTRRRFLGGLLAAPMVVKAEVLMPVRKVIVPDGVELDVNLHPGPDLVSEMIVRHMREVAAELRRAFYVPEELLG